MTTPGVPPPEGAITGGDLSALDGLDEASWRANLRADKLSGYDEAHVTWQGAYQRPFDQMAPISDGQIPLQNRAELLREVTAYGSAVMGKNWQLPGDSTWRDVPFDTQLGPSKHVEVITDPENPKVGFLQITGGGLWRADLMMNGRGVTTKYGFTRVWNGTYWRTVNDYTAYPVRIDYRIVIAQGGQLIYRRDYISAGVPYSAYSQYVDSVTAQVFIARSASFPATFVFDPAAGPATVKVQARAVPYTSGFFSETQIEVFGGTEKSALCVTRWSIDDIDQQLVIDPPVGGTL